MIVFITKNDVINIQFNHAFKSIADENQKKICKELFCQLICAAAFERIGRIKKTNMAKRLLYEKIYRHLNK